MLPGLLGVFVAQMLLDSVKIRRWLAVMVYSRTMVVIGVMASHPQHCGKTAQPATPAVGTTPTAYQSFIVAQTQNCVL